ncbi:DUF4287 domain-containing protein [Phenylobacterium sp.]|jgi:hypothetical protein|uniref:DUF4287 domain-containing protein n=1 Tax=Phenylobacterium sp. TaxID=1871053 RepID=UPI002E337264|nr:DUF4287 domain-containing protein [Phenylobacterium sp.]HEX3364791.1 DUF4287 domain-containing protein [Phenylobacterium sp.]
MTTADSKPLAPPPGLTPRQQKWFASVQASLERDTGKTLDEWVAIARTCPETKERARAAWLKERYGLLQNRAMHVLSVAFPSAAGWDEPEKLKAALWTDPQATAILEALQAAATALPDVVMGQRKAFTAFSRKFQFASIKPAKAGKAVLGLALTPQDDPRLEAPKNEGWSERLKAKMLLESPADIDAALLKQAWERS